MIITSQILTTISNGGTVWLMGDTHLLKKEKDRPRIIINKNYDSYIKELEKIHKNDMLIFMGDFVDDTIPVSLFKREMDRLDKIPAKQRIWIRGNNDLFSAKTYSEYGFEVCYAATYHTEDTTYVVSHTSIDVSKYKHVKCIHGHMHRNDNSEMLYYHDPKGNYNIGQDLSAGYILSLQSVIQSIAGTENQSRWFTSHEKIGMSMFIHNEEHAEMLEDLKLLGVGGEQ